VWPSWLAHCALIALVAAQLHGQASQPSFDDPARAPGVDTAYVQWLRSHLTVADHDTVVRLVEALSRPEAVQLLPAFFYGTAESPFGRKDILKLTSIRELFGAAK
jgi:hypothetical protein